MKISFKHKKKKVVISQKVSSAKEATSIADKIDVFQNIEVLSVSIKDGKAKIVAKIHSDEITIRDLLNTILL